MNRSLIVLLSVVAIALAQLNCQTNGTTFAAVCTGATNANCSWENAAIWSGCNGTEPNAASNNALITANGATTYTMFLNGTAITAGNVTINAPGSTLSVYEDLNVETITLQSGSVFVNGDITLAQNISAFTIMNGTSVSLNGGDVTGSIVAQSGSTISFTGVNSISGLLTSNANIVMNTATATLNGLVSTLNGPISFSGANTLAGAGKLYVSGDLIMQQPAADTVTTVSITTNVTGTFEANTTVNVNNDLKATTLTVDPTGFITLNTAATPGSFNFSNVYVNDIVNTVANTTTVSNGQLTWASGNVFSAGNIVINGTWIISTAGVGTNATNLPTVYGTVSSNGDIIIDTDAVSIGHNINTDNLNIGGGTVQGSAGSALTVEANITWTAGNITVPTLLALGQVTITGTGEGTYKMLSSAVTASNVKLSCALDLNTNYVNAGTFVGEAASITSSNNYGATTFQNNGVLDGNINFSGVSLVNAGTIGLINVSTQLAFTDASLTLASTSRLIIGVGSAVPDPIFSFTRSNGSSVNITNTWAGSIEYVILGSFSPSADTNITLQTFNGANIINLGNFSSLTVNNNYTMMSGANANNCNFGEPIIDSANYQVIIPVTGCSAPSSGSNKTLIIVIVVVVVVLVIAAIIGVVVYRRRQHAHSAEKQRLI